MPPPKIWEKMDCTVDSDPRLVRCAPFEAVALAIYLFILRRAKLDGGGWESRGAVPPDTFDTFFMARMLFMKEPEIRGGLGACLKNGLLSIMRDGALLDVTGCNDPVTLVPGSQVVLISDWSEDWGYHRTLGSIRQQRHRERKKENDIADLLYGGSGVTSRNAGDASVTRNAIEEMRREEREHVDLSLVPDPSPTSDEFGGSETSSQSTKLVRPKKAVRPLATKIDECDSRCWGAADTLRRMIIGKYPQVGIATKPWDGRPRSATCGEWSDRSRRKPSGVDIVELAKTGNRLKWAHVIRLMIEHDHRTIEQIWEVMRWLDKGQPARLGSGFIVQSPESLRTKWDAICAVMSAKDSRSTEARSGAQASAVDQAVAQMAEALAERPAATPGAEIATPDLVNGEVSQ